MKNNSSLRGRVVGTLSKQEKTVLTAQFESSIKNYNIGLIFAYVSIIIIFGIVIVPALYTAIRRLRQKLLTIQEKDVEVYELKGVLGRKNGVSLFDSRVHGGLYIHTIDGYDFPGQVLGTYDVSGLQNYLGEVVTMQYVPALSWNRSYTESSGHGYNFITKTRI